MKYKLLTRALSKPKSSREHVRSMSIGPSGLKMIAVAILAAVATTNAFPQSNPLPCASPEYRQFDFWLGDWDVFESDSHTSAARVRVDRILGGCVLREHYEDNTGAVGESFTTYDAGRKLWHQTWVTNRGRLLTIEGAPKNGAMLLAGSYYRDNGQEVRVRGTWTPMGSNVRESALSSSDAGKTWTPWFDLSFRPRTLADKTAESDEATTVARLDERFQAAVKANDADTIDKILADDFVLVNGSGRFSTNRSHSQKRAAAPQFMSIRRTPNVACAYGAILQW